MSPSGRSVALEYCVLGTALFGILALSSGPHGTLSRECLSWYVVPTSKLPSSWLGQFWRSISHDGRRASVGYTLLHRDAEDVASYNNASSTGLIDWTTGYFGNAGAYT